MDSAIDAMIAARPSVFLFWDLKTYPLLLYLVHRNTSTFDMDLAGYDSCYIRKNFREPMLEALKLMDNKELFDPNEAP